MREKNHKKTSLTYGEVISLYLVSMENQGVKMKRTYTKRGYLDALQKKVMVYDGAMGTNLQLQNLTADQFGGEKTMGCNDYLVVSYPQAVEKVHRSFLEAGVDSTLR